jgi:hypothetical protein
MATSPLAWVFIDVPPHLWEASRRFWAQALGEEPRPDRDDPVYAHFPAPMPVRVGLQRIGGDDAPRVHLDLAAADVEAEARRLEALGASRVRAVEDWVVLRDPAGLLFCVVPLSWAAEASPSTPG